MLATDHKLLLNEPVIACHILYRIRKGRAIWNEFIISKLIRFSCTVL